MNVFSTYAAYYDLLYQDKNYPDEAQYVSTLLKKYAPHAQTILEFGCGTGKHALELAHHGYSVQGIDLSRNMVERALELHLSLPVAMQNRLKYAVGDLRNIRLGTRFDVVIALFHVFSYQITNRDLAEAFASAKAHLNPGGILLFDCWHGPAVLTDPPTVRVKEIKSDIFRLIRIASPTLHPNENTVDVAYHLIVINKETQRAEEIHETHTMRFLFPSEIELFSHQSGLNFITGLNWFSQEPLSPQSWNASYILKND